MPNKINLVPKNLIYQRKKTSTDKNEISAEKIKNSAKKIKKKTRKKNKTKKKKLAKSIGFVVTEFVCDVLS